MTFAFQSVPGGRSCSACNILVYSVLCCCLCEHINRLQLVSNQVQSTGIYHLHWYDFIGLVFLCSLLFLYYPKAQRTKMEASLCELLPWGGGGVIFLHISAGFAAAVQQAFLHSFELSWLSSLAAPVKVQINGFPSAARRGFHLSCPPGSCAYFNLVSFFVKWNTIFVVVLQGHN